jgi:hypothetical protein
MEMNEVESKRATPTADLLATCTLPVAALYKGTFHRGIVYGVEAGGEHCMV